MTTKTATRPDPALALWIQFDALWGKVLEHTSDEDLSVYWQEVYDAMSLVVPRFQVLAGQERFSAQHKI